MIFSGSCQELSSGWTMARCDPGAATPETIDHLTWYPATVPGTVAENLNHLDAWALGDEADLDKGEYWFQCRFPTAPGGSLHFEGLATLADVWLDEDHVLNSDNMFLAHSAALPAVPPEHEHHLVLRFSSLSVALEEKQPRAGWRTRLTSHRNLRFFRTSLLGRMPGICPSVPAIGPWKPIRVIAAVNYPLANSRIHTRVQEKQGIIGADFRIQGGDKPINKATLYVGNTVSQLEVKKEADQFVISGKVTLDDVSLWWPHTHGEPARYPIRLELQIGGTNFEYPLPPIGFRTVALSGSIEDFELVVNGEPIHCRGGCWIPPDITSLKAEPEALRDSLTLFRDAGMNMMRLSGITTYESDDFYELCDELGILVWQDFMFASMHYPMDDARFLQSIKSESSQFLERVSHRPSLAVFCSGSEIEQQVTMLGLSRDLAHSEWFDKTLPALCKTYRPDTVYCPHSPCAGRLPFYSDQGVSHYFAVGGYRQPVFNASLEPPRFASECLAFSIPPDQPTITADFCSTEGVDWSKYTQRIPRDNGSEWHFGEITDYYLEKFFRTDAQALREVNESLYLDAARIAVAETMRSVLEAWRYNEFTTGALIWNLRDFWSGAGWGILDSHGSPKAPYYFLKRLWQPVQLYFRDRGTNGLRLGLDNETAELLEGVLELKLCLLNGQVIQKVRSEVVCEPRNRIEWSVDELVGGFIDSSYAYRFGKMAYEIAYAEFTSNNKLSPVSTVYSLIPPKIELEGASGGPDISMQRVDADAQAIRFTLTADTFVDYVIIESDSGILDDNYFSLLPGDKRTITIRQAQGRSADGSIRAFNTSKRLVFSTEITG